MDVLNLSRNLKDQTVEQMAAVRNWAGVCYCPFPKMGG
jgi:hypothetical protein